MGLVLHETSVQVKYLSHASLTKKQMKEVMFIKARSTAISTERLLSRFNVETQHKLYLSRITKLGFPDLITRKSLSICVGFLFSQPYIYMDNFKDRHKGCKVIIHAYCDRRQKLL